MCLFCRVLSMLHVCCVECVLSQEKLSAWTQEVCIFYQKARVYWAEWKKNRPNEAQGRQGILYSKYFFGFSCHLLKMWLCEFCLQVNSCICVRQRSQMNLWFCMKTKFYILQKYWFIVAWEFSPDMSILTLIIHHFFYVIWLLKWYLLIFRFLEPIKYKNILQFNDLPTSQLIQLYQHSFRYA